MEKQAKLTKAKEELRTKLVAAGDQPSPSKTQSRRARAKKTAAEKAAAAQQDPQQDHGHKPDHVTPDNEADMEEDAKPTAKKLPTAVEIKAMEDSLTSPKPLSEDWTPEAVVDGRPQAKAKEQVEDFRGELEDCEVFLEMGDRAAKMGIDLKITKSRIAELKKLIEKAEKKVPERVSAAELTLLQEKYLERHKEKQTRSRKAAAFARQTFVQLQLAQQAQIDHWTQKLQASADAQMLRQEEWEEREEELEERHQKTMSEFEHRITLAQKEPEGQDQEIAIMPAQQQSPASLPERQKAVFFEQTALDFDHSKLPEVTEEDLGNTAAASACANLYVLLTQWLHAGAAVPFTFAQLAKEAAAGAEAKALVLRLLGEQQALWYRSSPAEDNDLIPRQAVIALLSVLGSAKAKYESREEITTNAAATYARLAAQHQQRCQLW